MLKSLRRFSKDEIAQERLRIIKFYDKHKEKACLEAFGVDRKLIYVWKKRLNTSKHLSSLIPYSTKPHRTRQMNTNPMILEFIKSLREKYPNLGKEKIKPLLDEYCRNINIPSIAEPTIGKIIKRKNYFFQRQGRIYHNPASRWNQKGMKIKRLRLIHPPSHMETGHIQADTVQRITNGIREYFYRAIDAKSKFALVLNYKNLNSRNMRDFYHKFKSVFPGKVKDWQTDNGLENLGELDEELKKDNIPHFFSYPRCPKINGIVERFNRTIQENFIDNYLDIIHDKILFNRQLADYIIFYNTKRPHKSLGLKSPMDYLISQGGLSNMSVAYTGN